MGVGRAGMIHAQNFVNRVARTRLVAIVDPHPPTPAAARKQLSGEGCSDYRRALGDPEVDAVVVATPTELHHDMVIEAARAGKHVLCEKPMAVDVQECDRMIDDCARVIGDIVLAKSVTRGPSVPHEWMHDIRRSSCPLAELNSHELMGFGASRLGPASTGVIGQPDTVPIRRRSRRVLLRGGRACSEVRGFLEHGAGTMFGGVDQAFDPDGLFPADPE